MKGHLCAGLVLIVSLVDARAVEQRFSATLSGADFIAAGLNKLSPEELARLDSLVGPRPAPVGAVPTPARPMAQDTPASVPAVTAAPAQSTADAKPRPPGLMAKAKVLLAPGTQVEYATVESRIVGEFRGWEAHATFRLENGDRWQTTGSGTYVTPPISNPAVRIVPSQFGGYWMSIDGVNQRVRVTPVNIAR
jgi:hypothetical protein